MTTNFSDDPRERVVQRLHEAKAQVGTGVIVGSDTFPVPWWSIVLAVICFICMQFVFHVVVAGHRDAPPFPLRVFLGLLTGTALAVWALLVGYVNKDSARRGMNRTLWTLVAMFVPNGIGFILYFLLRKPSLLVCPQCSAGIPASANYCPQCAHRFVPTCPQCGQAVGPSDAFCLSCGQGLRTAPGPASSS